MTDDRISAAVWLLVAVVIGSLTGCGRSYSSTPQQESPGRPKDPARLVIGFQVTEAPVERLIMVVGSLAALDRATLSTKVPGRLVSIPVDLGDRVKQGQLLAQIESRDYELRVQQAEALLAQARARVGLPLEGTDDDLDLEATSLVKQTRAVLEEAQANRERLQNLSQQGIISKSEVEAAEASYKVALSRYEDAIEEGRSRLAQVAQRRAELEIARQQRADTSIYAPFDGAIQERRANLGEFLASSAPVVSLVRMDPLRLRLEVSEREAHKIQAGQPVRITVEGTTNVYHGEIKRISPLIEEQSLVLKVEADVPNPGHLRPGMFVRADILTGENAKGIKIPKSAVTTFAGLEKVFTVEDGKAMERTVTTGRLAGETVEVLSGLASGQVVILEPGSLRTGETVRVGSYENSHAETR